MNDCEFTFDDGGLSVEKFHLLFDFLIKHHFHISFSFVSIFSFFQVITLFIHCINVMEYIHGDYSIPVSFILVNMYNHITKRVLKCSQTVYSKLFMSGHEILGSGSG